MSPKGLDTFRVLGENRVAYLDLTGSGVETIAHLRDNGRITVMLCSFEGPPRIVRLYGRGHAIGGGLQAALGFGIRRSARFLSPGTRLNRIASLD